MTTKTVYISFDDEEFESEQACRNYENKAMKCVEEMLEVYSLFDKNMNKYEFNTDDIGKFLVAFEKASDTCEYVKVKQIPSRTLHEFIWKQIGIIIPQEEIGFYRYDWQSNEWVSIN